MPHQQTIVPITVVQQPPQQPPSNLQNVQQNMPSSRRAPRDEQVQVSYPLFIFTIITIISNLKYS